MPRTLFLCHSATASISISTDRTYRLDKTPLVNTVTYSMSTTLGPVTPPTTSLQFGELAHTTKVSWISKKVATQIVVAATSSYAILRYRARETAAGANATIVGQVLKYQESGTYAATAIPVILALSELTTSMANYLRTQSCSVACTFEPGTRLAVQLFLDDAAAVTLSGTRQVLLEIGHTTNHTAVTMSDNFVFEDDVITKQHTTDSLKVNRLTKTHTTDSYKISRPTKTHTTDSLLRGTLTKTHTTDAYLAETRVYGITADLWQTFEFDTLNAASLEANDYCSEGSWTVSNSASRLTIATLGELAAPDTINGITDSGTRGLGYTNSGSSFQPGYVRYTFATGKSTGLSMGFWFYPASGMVGSFAEHDILALYINVGSDDVFIKANDFADGTNLDFFLHNSTAYSTNKITITAANLNKWHWITAQWKPGASWKFRIYNTIGGQVGAVTHQTTPSTNNIEFILVGSFIGASGAGESGTFYFDDLVLDWTDQTFPLGIPTLTKSHTTDSYLEAGTKTKTHTTDSYIIRVGTKTHTTNSLLLSQQTKTHTTNSFLSGVGKTHTTDAYLKSTSTKTHSTNSVLYGVSTKVHTTDSLLLATNTRTHTLDSFIQAPPLDNWSRLSPGGATWAGGSTQAQTWTSPSAPLNTWNQVTPSTNIWTTLSANTTNSW